MTVGSLQLTAQKRQGTGKQLTVDSSKKTGCRVAGTGGRKQRDKGTKELTVDGLQQKKDRV